MKVIPVEERLRNNLEMYWKEMKGHNFLERRWLTYTESELMITLHIYPLPIPGRYSILLESIEHKDGVFYPETLKIEDKEKFFSWIFENATRWSKGEVYHDQGR